MVMASLRRPGKLLVLWLVAAFQVAPELSTPKEGANQRLGYLYRTVVLHEHMDPKI